MPCRRHPGARRAHSRGRTPQAGAHRPHFQQRKTRLETRHAPKSIRVDPEPRHDRMNFSADDARFMNARHLLRVSKECVGPRNSAQVAKAGATDHRGPRTNNPGNINAQAGPASCASFDSPQGLLELRARCRLNSLCSRWRLISQRLQPFRRDGQSPGDPPFAAGPIRPRQKHRRADSLPAAH